MKQKGKIILTKDQALTRLMALCSRQEKCSSEILKKLEQWGFEESEQNKILKKLIEESFIDDKRYTGFYIKDKFRFNKWGRQKIFFQLKQKGIEEEIFKEAWKELITESDEEEQIRNELKNKNRNLKAKDTWDRRAKLIRFAQSRGYDYEMVNYVLDEILITES